MPLVWPRVMELKNELIQAVVDFIQLKHTSLKAVMMENMSSTSTTLISTRWFTINPCQRG
ncbi:hypothetical protein AFE_2099 [Acidithiobacillus ferrooxidans ATCC 23270]|uniref:Uncharacterized protein n=1 Tax=Acidithiobacillus ferrooxidans (strain ATCC 23270 / DSM 14882 / CIP 104768 / NCIMB 8455) TaxID=243159 RepID=B7J4V9_ACIF2|nr:hypothetical protein AFE_2099 [Acidithiobacillus ferrooxidans ATCC 23270]